MTKQNFDPKQTLQTKLDDYGGIEADTSQSETEPCNSDTDPLQVT